MDNSIKREWYKTYCTKCIRCDFCLRTMSHCPKIKEGETKRENKRR